MSAQRVAEHKVVSEPSGVNSPLRTRFDSISMAPPDAGTDANLENEEVLVEFFNVDVYPVPKLLLCKRNVGESAEVTEANYFYLALNINVQTQRILGVFQLKDRRMIVVICDHTKQQTEIYVEFASALASTIGQKCPKFCLGNMFDLVGLNFVQNILAVYSHVCSELVLLAFREESVEIINSACISISGLTSEVKRIMFIHGSSELCLVTKNGLRTFNLAMQL
ncbi:hypothetical protein K493DRAFT_314614, partial [Basidiobolus meristosporus CBS 931.73]